MLDDSTLVLTGTPPFSVELTIKNLASSEVRTEKFRTSDTEWKLSVPDYRFDTVGPHVITIDAVHDASKCAQAEPDVARRSLWVDVAETAAIIPLERRGDYCVGDVLNFQLEGNAPWRINYRFNGKLTSATSKQSQFSRVAGAPGEFSIVSLAHQQNFCQTAVNDVNMNIHPLPSAQVSNGRKIIENIREGDQAEILFTLIGEPPFTFTYQRAELATTKATSKTPRIAETHTVSNVWKHEHSIFSAQEGTWTVTFISDKWCRYPPAPADPAVETA